MTTALAPSGVGMVPSLDRRIIREAVGRIRDDARATGDAGWNDRRSSRRICVQRPVYVTPVLVQGGPPRLPPEGDRTSVAFTTDLSKHGVGLILDIPLPLRHALVTFYLAEQKLVSFVMELKWSRRRADRRYSSGGNLLAVIETPEFLRHRAMEQPLPTSIDLCS